MSSDLTDPRKDNLVWPSLVGFPINGRQIIGDSLISINQSLQSISLATLQANTVLINSPSGNYAPKNYGDMLTWDDSSAMWVASAGPSIDSSYTLRLTRAFGKLLIKGTDIKFDDQFNLLSAQRNGDEIQVSFKNSMGSRHYCVVASGSLRNCPVPSSLASVDSTFPFRYQDSPSMGKSYGIQVYGLTETGFKFKWPGLNTVPNPQLDFAVDIVVYSFWLADPREVDYSAGLLIKYTQNETYEQYHRNNNASFTFALTGSHQQLFYLETTGTYGTYASGVYASGAAIAITGMDGDIAGEHVTKVRDLLFGTSWKFKWTPAYNADGGFVPPEGRSGTTFAAAAGKTYSLSFEGEDIF